MFENEQDSMAIEALLKSWTQDTCGAKDAFISLKDTPEGIEGAVLSFHPRAGISYSLRAALFDKKDKPLRLFSFVDIVEDASGKWLSVCFYEEMITDSMDLGEKIPQGLLGEDGYCFHVTEYDERLIVYLKEKILEAFSFVRDEKSN